MSLTNIYICEDQNVQKFEVAIVSTSFLLNVRGKYIEIANFDCNTLKIGEVIDLSGKTPEQVQTSSGQTYKFHKFYHPIYRIIEIEGQTVKLEPAEVGLNTFANEVKENPDRFV